MVKNKNILVTGANGQLGVSLKEISNNYDYNFYFKKKIDLDITDFLVLEKFLKNNNINIIINCAAYTDVASAEKNQALSNAVNNLAVGNIARLCHELKIQLIHISTDYVFDGLNNIPLQENDKKNPQNYYGQTKLDGENKILSGMLENSAIIRTSWLYSNLQNNFMPRLLSKLNNQKKILVVEQEVGSPTNAIDLAKVIMKIIPKLSNLNVLDLSFFKFRILFKISICK